VSAHGFAARSAWAIVRPVLRPIANAAIDALLGPAEDTTRPNTAPLSTVDERLHAVAVCVEWERGIRADERRRIRAGDDLRGDQVALNIAPELMPELTAGISARFVRLQRLPDGSVDMIVRNGPERDDEAA